MALDPGADPGPNPDPDPGPNPDPGPDPDPGLLFTWRTIDQNISYTFSQNCCLVCFRIQLLKC